MSPQSLRRCSECWQIGLSIAAPSLRGCCWNSSFDSFTDVTGYHSFGKAKGGDAGEGDRWSPELSGHLHTPTAPSPPTSFSIQVQLQSYSPLCEGSQTSVENLKSGCSTPIVRGESSQTASCSGIPRPTVDYSFFLSFLVATLDRESQAYHRSKKVLRAHRRSGRKPDAKGVLQDRTSW